MKAYKFLNSSDVRFWTEDCTLMLSKVSYFRLLFGSEWIHDPAEVRAVNNANFTLSRGGQSSVQGRRLAQLGVLTAESAENITFSGTKFVRFGPDYFILCTSVAEFDVAREGMEKAPVEERYDACIEIADLETLMQRVLSTGIVQTLGNKPVLEIWDGLDIESVKYQANEVEIQNEDPIEPSPFVKHLKYEHQHEVRCVFDERNDLPERLQIKFTPPPNLIRDTGWRGSVVSVPSPSPQILMDRGRAALRRLNQVFEELGEYPRRATDSEFRARMNKESAMWAKYEAEADPELRLVCREIRRLKVRSDFIDFMCQRPFSPAFQWQIQGHLPDLLNNFAQRYGIDAQ